MLRERGSFRAAGPEHGPTQAPHAPRWEVQVCAGCRASPKPEGGLEPTTHLLVLGSPSPSSTFPSSVKTDTPTTTMGCLSCAVRPHVFKGRHGSVTLPAFAFNGLRTGPRLWREERVWDSCDLCLVPTQETESTKQPPQRQGGHRTADSPTQEQELHGLRLTVSLGIPVSSFKFHQMVMEAGSVGRDEGRLDGDPRWDWWP